MADSAFKSLNRAAFAWAVTGAVRFAAGTCVVALILAATLSGEAAERFATTGYLAAIFAALALALARFLGVQISTRAQISTECDAVSAPRFPAFLFYVLGMVLFVSVVAGLVSQPGAEMLALLACFAFVGAAVLLRCGTVATINAMLLRGGILAGATRYAILIGVCALVLAAIVGGDAADSLVQFGLRMTIVAAMLVAASLLAPRGAGMLDRLTRDFVFERMTSVAAIAAAALMVVASLLPAQISEPFAIAAYVAAAFATVGVAMESRRLRS